MIKFKLPKLCLPKRRPRKFEPKRIREYIEGLIYSLRASLIALILLGILCAGCVYATVHTALRLYIDLVYASEEKSAEREEEYVAELQQYLTERGATTEDVASISEWTQQDRYIYLLIYRDTELIYSSGEGEGSDEQTRPSTQEELYQYAKENGMHPLELSDGTLLCSVADYTEELYYDLNNFISLVAAVIALCVVLIYYFQRVTQRITRLADDVAVVSRGEMNHVIRTDKRRDEIKTLCDNVENMRSSIVETLESERAAINANTELITSMSHDIRTPLTVLLGYLDVMKLHTEDETLRSYIRASELTALRLKKLSDDMFQYFLVFSGKELDVHLEPYSAGTLIEQMLAEHMLLLSENGHAIDYQVTLDSEAELLTDAPKLMRIIDNVFSNLTKYADPQELIKIRAEQDNEYIYLHFHNKKRTDTANVESNRIGLKTCVRIAEAMNSRFVTEEQGDNFLVDIALPRMIKTADCEEGEK